MTGADDITAADDPVRRLRVLGRITAAFLLDLLAIARGDDDPLDTLIVAAIVQANTAEIRQHADLQLAFARLDRPPPDAMRRPVSVNAIAASLNLPFETARRRIGALAAQGACRFVEGGVIVPAQALLSPRFAKDDLGYARTRAFYRQLREFGLLAEMPPPTAEIAPGGAPARAVWRLIGTYMLRVAEELSRVGHLMDGIILFEVFRSNTEHWPPEVRGEEGTTAADMVPDTMRRPVTPGGVARRLGLPPETVRRHALRLVDRGLLARVPGGLILPAETLARQNVFPALAANAANLQRMMGALSQLGVLRLWDAEEAGDHGQEHAAAVG